MVIINNDENQTDDKHNSYTDDPLKWAPEAVNYGQVLKQSDYVTAWVSVP